MRVVPDADRPPTGRNLRGGHCTDPAAGGVRATPT
jgi:hypothetical protein